MRSQQELYNAAMRTISAHRQQARTQAAQTQETLEIAFPALRAAEATLRIAGIQMALAGANGLPLAPAQETLANAKKARDAVLADLGRAPDALSPKFACTKCNDTGAFEGKTCSCVRKEMQALRRAEIEESSSLRITNFASMDMQYYPDVKDPKTGQNARTYMKNILSDLQDYATEFDEHSVNLFLFGNCGLGKTHAALAIAGAVLEKWYDVIYISAPDFFSRVESCHFNGNNEEERAILNAVTNAELLILDDLGTELITSFSVSTFYTLLNNRMSAHRPTIFTSNITDNVMLEKCYTEKIASRLAGNCEPFHFIGNDIREIKANEF